MMSESPQARRTMKLVVPPIAEQLVDPAGLAVEMQQLQALIREHRTLHYEKMLITQRVALAMLLLNVGNRRLTRAWVEKLKRILMEGRWRVTHQAAAFDTNGYLRNGQHRLKAIAETGIAAEMMVAFGEDPAAFQALDVGVRRTGAQFLELEGTKNANLVQAFVRLQHRLATNGEALDDQGVFLAGRELNHNELLQRAIAAGFRLHSMATVSAASFAYWKIAMGSPQRERLGKFWDQLVEGYELSRGDPILEARRILIRAKEATKRPHQTMQQTLQVVWIIWAWNEWVEGNTGAKPPRWTKLHGVLPVREAH